VPRSAKTAPKPVRRECDLSAPIQNYLSERGYTVRCEVRDCDVTAIRDEELIVVELKRQFSTDLLMQAVDRQRVADAVYVALPIEGANVGRGAKAARWRGIEGLLKRLDLGLIRVHFMGASATVELVHHPAGEPVRPRCKPRGRQAILREIAGRAAGDHNEGGVSKRRLVTAYREQCIHIALCLRDLGPQSPAALRARGTSDKTQAMLRRDVYGWFERRSRGLYALRSGAEDAIRDSFSGPAAFYEARLAEERATYVSDGGPAPV
jgi:hypothetical protein